MSISNNNGTLIKYLEFDDKIHIYLTSGDILVIPYVYTDRLSKASNKELRNYHLIAGGIGVHFEDIDEDISLNGIIRYKMQHELIAS